MKGKMETILFMSLLLSVNASAADTADTPDTVNAADITDASGAVRVSYLGPAGTYTEEASQFWFQNGEELIPKETVGDAIADMLAGDVDFAVIPQENTVGGAVVNYVDALIAAD